MFKRRLIPVLFIKDGWIVRSEGFSFHQVLGEPSLHAERMRQWQVDELVLLDISRGKINYEHIRRDYKNKPQKELIKFLKRFGEECSMPLSFGGNIRNYEDIQLRIENGADKVILNSLLYTSPEIIKKTVKVYGAQSVVASVDYKNINNYPKVFINNGSFDININLKDWVKKVEEIGVGEILLQSIDSDGFLKGYDINNINLVCDQVNIPVVACSGAGNIRHILECYNETKAEAVAAGNIFHFTENAYPRFKKMLCSNRKDIREELEYGNLT